MEVETRMLFRQGSGMQGQCRIPNSPQGGAGATGGTLTWEPDAVTLLAGAGGMVCTPDGRALQCERRVKGWDG
jgi:hypothetical protein